MEPERRIVASVDLTDHAPEVIREAVATARAFGAALSLVHVIHDLESMYGIYLGGGSVGTLQADIDAEAQSRLHSLYQEHVQKTGLTGEAVLLKGVPWSEVVGYAVRTRAERIILGAHVSRKPEHKILGSTAERVLRNAPCPVLIVPPAPPLES